MSKKQENGSNMPVEKITLIQKLAESGYMGYIFLTLITFLGGSVRYVKGLAKGQAVNFRNWLIEMVISAFVALMTGLLCAAIELDYIWSCIVIGWSAHEGTRALYLLRNFITKKLDVPDSGKVPDNPSPVDPPPNSKNK